MFRATHSTVNISQTVTNLNKEDRKNIQYERTNFGAEKKDDIRSSSKIVVNQWTKLASQQKNAADISGSLDISANKEEADKLFTKMIQFGARDFLQKTESKAKQIENTNDPYFSIKSVMIPLTLYGDHVEIDADSRQNRKINDLPQQERVLQDKIKKNIEENKGQNVDLLLELKNLRVATTKINDTFLLACKAIEMKNFGFLEFILGPTVYACEQDYFEEYRSQRFYWLQTVLKRALYAEAKSVVYQAHFFHKFLKSNGDTLLRVVNQKLQSFKTAYDTLTRDVIAQQFDPKQVEKQTTLFKKSTENERKYDQSLEAQISDIQRHESEVIGALLLPLSESLDIRILQYERISKLHAAIKSRFSRNEEIPVNIRSDYGKIMRDYIGLELKDHPLSSIKVDSIVLNDLEVNDINDQLFEKLQNEIKKLISYLNNLFNDEIRALHQDRVVFLEHHDIVERYKDNFIKSYQDYLNSVLNEFNNDVRIKFQNNRNVIELHDRIDKQCTILDKEFDSIKKSQKNLVEQYGVHYKKTIADFRENMTGWLSRNTYKFKKEVTHDVINFLVDNAISRGRDTYSLRDMRDNAGNTLLHLVTRQYAIVSYENNNINTDNEIDFLNLQKMVKLLCEHGYSIYTLNNIEVTKGISDRRELSNNSIEEKYDDQSISGQTAFEYANDQLLLHVKENGNDILNKSHQTCISSDYFLLKTVLQSVPTYSVLGSDLKNVLLKSCDKARHELESTLNQWFYKDVIRIIRESFYIAEIVCYSHRSSRELSDMLLIDQIYLLKNQNEKSSHKTSSLLNTIIFSPLEKAINGKAVILSASTNDINKLKDVQYENARREKMEYREKMLKEKHEKEAAQKSEREAIARVNIESERANRAVNETAQATEAARIESEARIQAEARANIQSHNATEATERANTEAAARARLEAERDVRDARIRELEARLAEHESQERTGNSSEQQRDLVPDRTISSASHATMFLSRSERSVHIERSISVAASATDDTGLEVGV